MPRWALVRSVAKFLGPDLRLALVAADEETADRLHARLGPATTWVSHLLQHAVAGMLADPRDRAAAPDRARRVRRARRAAGRRAATALDRSTPDGLNVWIETAATADALAARGWRVRPAARVRGRRARSTRCGSRPRPSPPSRPRPSPPTWRRQHVHRPERLSPDPARRRPEPSTSRPSRAWCRASPTRAWTRSARSAAPAATPISAATSARGWRGSRSSAAGGVPVMIGIGAVRTEHVIAHAHDAQARRRGGGAARPGLLPGADRGRGLRAATRT